MKRDMGHRASAAMLSGEPMSMTAENTLGNMRENWPEAVSPQSGCVIMIQRLAALSRKNARAALASYGLGFIELEILAALRPSPSPHKLLPSALYKAPLISSGGLTKALNAGKARPRCTSRTVRRPQTASDCIDHEGTRARRGGDGVGSTGG